jgi:hypothetical protein
MTKGLVAKSAAVLVDILLKANGLMAMGGGQDVCGGEDDGIMG